MGIDLLASALAGVVRARPTRSVGIDAKWGSRGITCCQVMNT